MTTRRSLLAALLLMGFTVSTTFGAAHKAEERMTTFQKVFLKQYSGETDKMVSLAEAFSEKGFEWRPADGIRSVRETILHVASANYGLGKILGKDVPSGLNPREFERSIKGKAETIQVLKDSIEFAKEAVQGLDEESLDEEVKFFGMEAPRMSAAMILGGHAYEHLGQLIAYARSSDVVPPWSQ